MGAVLVSRLSDSEVRKVAELEHKYLLRYYSAFKIDQPGLDYKFAIVTELCTGDA